LKIFTSNLIFINLLDYVHYFILKKGETFYIIQRKLIMVVLYDCFSQLEGYVCFHLYTVSFLILYRTWIIDKNVNI